MKELAWQMHDEKKFVIPFRQLRTQVIKRFHERVEVDYHDAFWGEIRTCTFLTRDSSGNYGFAHKSFIEYFTAAYLAPRLRHNQAPETAINEEIRQFLHQLLKKVDYRSDEFQFKGTLPPGLKPKPGDPFTFIHEKDQSEMVWIPPGQFIAGGEMDDNEKPTRILRLEQGAFLDKYLVTNQQYARFLNDVGRCEDQWIDLKGSFKNESCRIQSRRDEFVVEAGYEQHPVNFVSFFGAEAYAEWVGKQLPSEWLWEKAGRGIDGRTYPWGDDWDWDQCNSAEHWARRDLSKRKDWEKWFDSQERLKAHIKAVTAFSQFPAPFGCIDLSGNLWEWMAEWWSEKKDSRVVRGGCFSAYRDGVRLPYRYYCAPTGLRYNLGFRLSRTN